MRIRHGCGYCKKKGEDLGTRYGAQANFATCLFEIASSSTNEVSYAAVLQTTLVGDT